MSEEATWQQTMRTLATFVEFETTERGQAWVRVDSVVAVETRNVSGQEVTSIRMEGNWAVRVNMTGEDVMKKLLSSDES